MQRRRKGGDWGAESLLRSKLSAFVMSRVTHTPAFVIKRPSLFSPLDWSSSEREHPIVSNFSCHKYHRRVAVSMAVETSCPRTVKMLLCVRLLKSDVVSCKLYFLKPTSSEHQRASKSCALHSIVCNSVTKSASRRLSNPNVVWSMKAMITPMMKGNTSQTNETPPPRGSRSPLRWESTLFKMFAWRLEIARVDDVMYARKMQIRYLHRRKALTELRFSDEKMPPIFASSTFNAPCRTFKGMMTRALLINISSGSFCPYHYQAWHLFHWFISLGRIYGSTCGREWITPLLSCIPFQSAKRNVNQRVDLLGTAINNESLIITICNVR